MALIGLTVALAAACGSGGTRTTTDTERHADPPLLRPWQQVGGISLGEPQRQVFADYGGVGHGYHLEVGLNAVIQGYYRLQGSQVEVDFSHKRVNNIIFRTPYYRTKSGFGVGSKIRFGACVRTWTHACGHRWHGFVWNEVYKAKVCGCWAKVGTDKASLRPVVSNFERRWTQIFVSHGRVVGFYLSRHYVD
jgi:hypothetical protein